MSACSSTIMFYVYNFFLLYCYYYSVMYVTVMPLSAYMALAFVFGFQFSSVQFSLFDPIQTVT